jgi:hypothetical protein
MRAIFNWQKMGIFWWGLVTALVFMLPEAWITTLASAIRSIDTTPFSIVRTINSEMDKALQGVLKLVQFDQTKALVFIGPYGIANLFVGILFAVVLLVFAGVWYYRAARTRGLVDDFIAMGFLYVVLRVIGLVSTSWHISVLDYIHSREPTSYLLILTGFMLILMGRGEGFSDSKVFFKVLFEAIIVWTLIEPTYTLQVLAWVVERPAVFHQILTVNSVLGRFYPMIVAIWAMLGLGIAAANLYGAGKVVAPAESGGGGGDGKGKGKGGGKKEE